MSLDKYYERHSQEAIEKAIEYAKDKSLEEIRFAIHRAYPFGPNCEGKAYKIWNRLVLAKEAELGFEPKRHAKKPPNHAERHILEVVEKVLKDAEGKSADAKLFALRRSYPFKDGKKGKSYMIWSQLVAEKEREISEGANEH